jgi:very-short-patch-repair endonuclease
MRKITNEEFVIRSRAVHGDKYDYSEAHYEHSQVKLKIICKTHGAFYQRAGPHMHGHGCARCRSDLLGRRKRLTNEQFIAKCTKVHNGKYSYELVKYTTGQAKVSILCKTHGVFEQTAENHLRGSGCMQCRIDSHRINREAFIKKSVDVHGDKYDYSLVNYVSCMSKVVIICREHGEFKQTPADHMQGYGCPRCHFSKGEEAISSILNALNVNYIAQAKFKGCSHISSLKFDFFIPSLKLLVEYDGEQHFRPVDYFGGDRSFKLIKTRDAIKTAWAKDNGYNLLRLDYTMSREVIEQKIRETLNIKEVA